MTLKELLNLVKNLPIAGKIISIIAFVLALVVYSFFISSCGTMTSATIRNIQPDTSTAITITNNTQMDTDVSTSAQPSVSISKSN